MPENIKCRLNEKGKLLIVIDPSVEGEVSGTGKSDILANARWLDLSDLEGGENLKGVTLNLMLIRKHSKKGTTAKVKKKASKATEEDDFVETKKKIKGKKPKLNKDATGKVKAIASSKRPSDKLKTKRTK